MTLNVNPEGSSVFQQEEDSIRHAQSALDDVGAAESPLSRPFELLLASYERLWAHTQRIMRMSDRFQQQLQEARAAETKVSQALAESEQRYRLLAEHSMDVIWTVELPSEKILYISPSIERLRGVSVEEGLRETLADSMTPESHARLSDALKRQAESVELAPSLTVEIQQSHKDGTLLDVEARITLIRDSSGAVVQAHGVSRDVSARKRVEAQLADKMSQLEEALAHVRTLQGILPICMCCHRIRTDAQSWQRLESYIMEHSDVRFTHGLCPSCAEKWSQDK
jgi:PAS domain S-box-containing protein